MENNRHTMMQQIHALDFALVELNLFLDTHPCNAEALETFKSYRMQREEKVTEYERCFGPIVHTAGDVNGDRWCWIDSPWPWEF